MVSKTEKFLYRDYEMNNSFILETLSAFPEKVDEFMLEEFIDRIRCIYWKESSDQCFRDGRFLSHEEVFARFKK